MKQLDPPPAQRRAEELVGAERTLIAVRWFAVVFGALQVRAYENMPTPPGVEGTAFVLVAVLLAANVASVLALRGRASARRAWSVATLTLAVDAAVVVGSVWLYTFDNESVFFLMMFVLPAEAALKFRLSGALSLWAAVTAVYVAQQFWGAATYGFDVSWPSITYRMGMLLLVSLILGLFASRLERRSRQLTKALDRLTDARDRLEREAEWRTALINMLAHDFRSPVGSATSSLLLVKRQMDELPKETMREMVEAAVRQNRRALALADDILTMARSTRDRLEPSRQNVRVASLLHRVVEWLGMQDLVTVHAPADLRAFVDPARFEQVVTNLLSNASKHGRPPITVEAVPLPDRGVELRVADTGSGVPDEQQAGMFGQFASGPRKDSVGLGLWLVATLAEAHGGDVRYLHADGQPTFVVRLRGGDARGVGNDAADGDAA